VLATIAFGIWFFSASNLPGNQGALRNYANDIGPGKQGATLTLANGKTIRLTDALNGQVAQEAGIVISKAADGQLIYELKDKGQVTQNKINTLSTAKGETYQLHLPDGSRVWLNAASSLTYTAGLLKDGKRKVMLSGEAYFEIAKDKQHPFIVETDKQEAEVLGTHFNIKSYKDDQTVKTTLLEGSLHVTLLNAGKVGGKLLKPGEASVFEQGSNIMVLQADMKETMAWKNGFFRFTAQPIDKVMQQIGRWYDIEVVYAGKMPEEEFNGVIARNKNISEVLNMLSYANAVKFKVEGRRVTVMK
jgi:transmembrane sensor